MNQPNPATAATGQRAHWVRPVVHRLNANHARIGTRPSSEDGAFSTS